MDIRKVKKLIEMLEESEVSEIEIHEGEESVRISRVSSLAPTPQQVVQVVDKPGAAPSRSKEADNATAGLAVSTAAQSTEPMAEQESDGEVVTAPMVGIFYESAAPGKPAFVELGQSVKIGDVLCIIEAMKIMNHIEAEASGVISKIMVENGEPVEYGQPLFLIREA